MRILVLDFIIPFILFNQYQNQNQEFYGFY